MSDGRSTSTTRPQPALRRMLLPLALAQFICSFAGSNMNVMINDISKDLDTTVQGVQVAITIFLLVMAALMIPGGKLTDRYGRKRCFTVGLVIYGIGALISAVSPGLGVLILGQLDPRGRGHGPAHPAGLHPDHAAVHRDHLPGQGLRRDQRDGRHRRRRGAADRRPDHLGDQLAGGVRVPGAGRRASSCCSAGGSRIRCRPTRPGRSTPAARSCRRSGWSWSSWASSPPTTTRWLMLGLVVAGALVLLWFFASVRAKERAGEEPLLSTSLFRNRTSNLGLVTQNAQWLLLTGVSFVVSAYLQVVRGYDAIQTGVIFTADTLGLLVASLAAERLAKRLRRSGR